MILRIEANHASFHAIDFTTGPNIVLAERTKESTRKDSRNGLGKSMLIEVIHYCLGQEARRGHGLLVPPLKGWAFTADLLAGERRLRVNRSVDQPGHVVLEGDVANLPGLPQQSSLLGTRIDVREWSALLGHLWFGLDLDVTADRYRPSFRSLISYFIRHGRDAFNFPFGHHGKQPEADKQVQIAFLLGLAWEDARDVHLLKDKAKALQDLKKAITAGVLEGYEHTRGDLEARRIRLKEKARVDSERLANFKVHPQYAEIRDRADSLTREVHGLANTAVTTHQLLRVYERDLGDEQAPAEERLVRVYEEAGAALPERVVRRLEDVTSFHRSVVRNRREFLLEEVRRLRQVIVTLDAEIARLSDQRAEILQVLTTHGALEEYTSIQTLHLENREQLKRIDSLIANWRQLEEGTSLVRIEQELLLQRARRDYDERAAVREEAVRLFNANSEALYAAPGRLSIDFRPKGFHFAVEIERSGSHGVENMKVFCFDLMLAQLWSERAVRPGLLVHDSRLFDGVDERQKALAIQLASREAETRGFQYICSMNSDDVPWSEVESDFDIKQYVRLTLTDAEPAGSLFGFRF